MNRLEDPSRRRVMLLLVAALWHVPLWLVLRPEMPVRVAPGLPGQSGMALTFLPLSQEPGAGLVETDARILWSPVLFSLPSPVGFSKPLAPPGFMPSPATERHHEGGVLLMTPLTPGRELSIMASDPLDQQARYLLNRREVMRLPSILHQDAVQPTPGIRVTFSDTLADRAITGVPIDPATLPVGTQAWQAVLALRFAPEGWPVYAILDRGTGDELLDQALLRQVLRLRLEDTAEPREGRVEVSFQP